MDAASQFIGCGIEPLRRNFITHGYFPHERIRVSKRTHRVFAVTTGPKPTRNDSVKPPSTKAVKSTATRSPPSKINGVSTRIGDVSEEIKRVRAQMEEDEQLSILMRGLRGQNLSDSQFAENDIQIRLVELDESSEFLPLVYDPASISAYWGKRPRAVATRAVQLLSVAGGFLSRLAWDVINNKVKENEVARAIELREIVTSLGPAYIKLGQALSIRPDILSPSAMVELQKLCDKVPSFPDDVAMALIEEELGQPWQNIYSELSSSPIAAASLGQVYKGRLKENGNLVAVKVQRPFVLETVTIDLFIIRNLGLVLRKFPQVSVDVVGLVDEWAARFFEELDYVNEGENGMLFSDMMRKDLPQVIVPKTYPKYTSRKVLTTEWIDGEKLSQSTESDVGELVSVGVICYLKQLLDTGFFHADPHPGNLIRTPDGKLAILDFGLVTKLTDDQKYGMIEAIAHLIHRDYEAIVKDFVKLGFIPEGVNLEPILPVLAKVFDQALEGGGAKNINFQELASDLAQITFDYPFRIPPYFALIIRAIGVLEGIALVGDPDFAIVDEAYPYIAQRLLTDESPRLRNALRYTIYGKSGIFDAERFIDVMQAFENFITAAKSGGGEELSGDMAELGLLRNQTESIVPVFLSSPLEQQQPIQTRAALGFLLSDKGNFFREFLLDEIVKGIDAVTREQLVRMMALNGFGNATLMFSMVPTFGPFKPAGLLPTVSEEDKVILNNVQKVVDSGNLEDACSLYEQAIAIEKGKEHSETLSMLFAQYSRFVYLAFGNAEKAREILVEALEHVQLSKPLLEAIIHFESIQSRPKQIDYIDSLVVKFIDPNSESSIVASIREREELSCIFLEFLNLFGDAESIKRAEGRHAKFFLPHRSTFELKKRSAEDFLASDKTKIAKTYSGVASPGHSLMGAYPNAQNQWAAGYGVQPQAWPPATQAQGQQWTPGYAQQAAAYGAYGYTAPQIPTTATQSAAYASYPPTYPAQQTFPPQSYAQPAAAAAAALTPAQQPASGAQAYYGSYY